MFITKNIVLQAKTTVLVLGFTESGRVIKNQTQPI